MATLKRGEVEIHFKDGGRGPAILLSHGYGATGSTWDGQRAALEPDYRVVTWDMRGHGSTSSPGDPALYSHEHATHDMLALLDHLGIERAVVGGLSVGGHLALAFYMRHPERVRALVLADTGPGDRDPAAWARRRESVAKWERNLEEKGIEYLNDRSHEMQRAIPEHRSARGLALAARGMLVQHDTSVLDSLPNVRVPALVICGEKDEPFIGPSQYMAKTIPGARLEMIARAGHASNLDQPEAFNRVLLEFLVGLAGE